MATKKIMIIFDCLHFLIYTDILAQEPLFLQGISQLFDNFFVLSVFVVKIRLPQSMHVLGRYFLIRDLPIYVLIKHFFGHFFASKNTVVASLPR